MSSIKWKTLQHLIYHLKLNGLTTEIRLQRDILRKLVQYSHRNNAYVDVENLLEYPVVSVCLALGNSDGTISKTCKSMLSNTAISDLVTVDKTNLSWHDVINMYYLDLAVRTKPKDSFIINIADIINMAEISFGIRPIF